MNIKHLLGAAIAAIALTGVGHAQQQFFRIGAGSTSGSYYPVGGMIASAVSQPGKIIATAQASNGALANINAVDNVALEAGLVQSDVAAWAYSGTGAFEGKPKASDLRLIANLYPESIQLVAKKGLGIKSAADLKGKRVALDERGSAAFIDARLVLAAYGVKESDIKAEYIKPALAASKLKDGSLDAFFFVGSAPANSIAELASGAPGIELVPLAGPEAQALLKSSPWFALDSIPAGTYKDVAAVQTLAVGAQLVTNAKIEAETVYQITKAMYSDAAQKALQAGHAAGRFITKDNALKGMGIPLHPGAERFYKEAGWIK
jgi:TRAP transporter TAXI family solute receptor